MGFPRLNFSKLWTNPTDFPTVELDETQVRADMQALHDESRAALNNLMTALEAKAAAGNMGAVANDGATASTVQKELNALNKALTDAGNLPTGGSAGQVLWKQSEKTFDASWHTPIAKEFGAFGLIAEIPAGADMDDYTTMGSYYATGANAASVVNAPFSTAFHLYVFQAQDARIVQVFTVTSASDSYMTLVYRKCASGTWSGFRTLADTDYAVAKAGDKMTGDLGIERATAPSYRLKNTGLSREMMLTLGDILVLANRVSDDNTNRSALFLGDEKADLTTVLRLYRAVAGAVATYNVLHTGNVDAVLGASKIVTGTYTGNAGETANTVYEQTIPLGFTPKVVLVSTKGGEAVMALTGVNYSAANCTPLEIVTAGFAVAYYHYVPANENLNSHEEGVNESGEVYSYIAIG